MPEGKHSTPPVIALTGGIASGKTAVSDRLAELGAAVIDTDQIAREVVEPGEAGLSAIVDHFGSDILDGGGELNRRALREHVFRDQKARQRLESLLHPLIERRVKQAIARHHRAPYIVLVVPLLVETGLFADADQVIVVDAPEDEQLKRLRERDQVDERLAQSMLKAQARRAERLAAATHVIDNSGDMDSLLAQVDALHARLVGA
ncbi:MAG: dephospho-CoA kinase [Wenzhouxiangella sp.]